MKVLHMLDSLNRGGAEMLALDVCRNAKLSNLDLTFVATGGGDLETEFRNSGVEFIQLDRRLPVDFALASRLRQIITERKIEVGHTQQPVEALHLYLATRGSAVQQVLTLHGIYAGRKNALALRFVLPRMDARVVVSNDVLRLAREQGFNTSRDFYVINNAVDPKRLCSTSRKLRQELELSEETVLLGMLANFYAHGRKDQLTVCKALPQLFACAPNTRFVFIGGAANDAKHFLDQCVTFCRANGIGDRVHFLGKRSDIPDVLSSLDIFVLSSVSEGSPIAAIEAMMIGVPAVLSDIGALCEVSANGRCAMLFKTGDADDLARKMVQLAGNLEHRASLAFAAKEWAASQFSIEVHISNLLKLYERLVA